MRFSTRTLYGLKAILVLAARYGEGSMAVSQIAKKEGISVAYLEQILNALKKKELVKSVRGPQGGYVLSKKPAELTLHELFDSLNSNALRGKEAKTGVTADANEASLGCALFWQKFESALQSGLCKITLKDLVDEARLAGKSKSRVPSPTFHI